MNPVFEGIFREGKYLYTESLVPDSRHFEEPTVRLAGKEYRQWDARSSKLASSILKGMKSAFLKSSRVLYLGASHGYTASYVSDIASNGFVYAIDFAPRVVRDLVFVVEKRKNMAALLADAKKPESYYHYIAPVDIVFQDIAQKNQVEIFLKNVNLFLRKPGFAYLALKARSIDSAKDPKKIYQEVRRQLEEEMKIIDYRLLDPFQKDHCMFLCTKR